MSPDRRVTSLDESPAPLRGGVAIVGLGGLGCPAASALARAGVRLGLFDPDRVEPSNLPRQLLYREKDVGRLKVEVAAERLTELSERDSSAFGLGMTNSCAAAPVARPGGPAVGRHSERSEESREKLAALRQGSLTYPGEFFRPGEGRRPVETLSGEIVARAIAIDATTASELEPFDVWIDGTDSLPKKLMLSDLALRARRPLIHAGAVRLRGQLLAIVPGRGPCLRCLVEEGGEAEATCRQAGILGPVVGTLGSLAALFALRALHDEDMAGQLVSFDAATGALRQRRVARRPDCPACARVADAEADVTGDVCPMTFVRARLALEQLAPGGRLGIVLRGEEPLANLPRSFQEEGHRVLALEPREGGKHYLLIEKAIHQEARKPGEEAPGFLAS